MDIATHGGPLGRVRATGKFFHAGGDKLYLRGVTYGTFGPDGAGLPFPGPGRAEADLAAMGAHGFNVVRTYTVPPRWMLDLATQHGVRMLVGLPWQQHVAFLRERSIARSIERTVRDGVRACRDHPAVLGFTIGNEILAPIVRWHGRRNVERFLRRLHDAVKDEDADALATYVNYPSTEYLDVSFADFCSFNVYLESPDRLAAYLARLHNIAGDRPLVLAEIGLDSRRNGDRRQAEVLDWQVRTVMSAGCAGAFVFAWTDEWHRGGYEIADWDFGLTTRDRRPKPALRAVERAFADAPLVERDWPRVSVIVCAHNAERTIGECLDAVAALDYPDYEAIVVDDGSTDATAEMAARSGARVIRTPNRGLSSARNTGLAAASGSIVAYLDSDAFPDRHWLRYLAASFMGSSHAGIGGPNIAPPHDGRVAECVARAPGGPIHVLLSDDEAEHIPGCNMAFRRERLLAVGGFDVQFDAAGDDVDACWRIQQSGGTLGFSPAAAVWHHPRHSVRGYWRQQRGYGRAEALLERKWPEKYNEVGHVSWRGRLYGGAPPAGLLRRRSRIYHGTWNTNLFQRVYEPGPAPLSALTLLPEWHLATAAFAAIGVFGLMWAPLLAGLAACAGAIGISALQAVVGGARSAPTDWRRRPIRERAALLAISTVLHLIQPVARLWGRARSGLTPWRCRGPRGRALPWRRTWTVWSEEWRAFEAWMAIVEARIARMGIVAVRGGDWDDWDLQASGGLLAAVRLRATVEEHGSGRQLLRFRVQARARGITATVLAVLLAAAAAAALGGAWVPAAGLATTAAVLVARAGRNWALVASAMRQATLDAEPRPAQARPQASVAEERPALLARAASPELASRPRGTGEAA